MLKQAHASPGRLKSKVDETGVVRLQCYPVHACVASAVLAICITAYSLLRELCSRAFSDQGRVNTSNSGLLLFRQTCV